MTDVQQSGKPADAMLLMSIQLAIGVRQLPEHADQLGALLKAHVLVELLDEAVVIRGLFGILFGLGQQAGKLILLQRETLGQLACKRFSLAHVEVVIGAHHLEHQHGHRKLGAGFIVGARVAAGHHHLTDETIDLTGDG
ncbi:hypothetical protein [Cobetia sp. ICG0124]|uniref:hypothetical protein n=1 Tax=Cobetia sp. ICG0124 TaxID=2053669 RepID=UPI001F0C0101|nr:hypothetical protein [Cobetia sp. ICG0124]